MKRKILFLACLLLCCVISFQMIAAGEVSNQNLTDSENSDTVQAVETDDEKILADDENEEIMQSTKDSEILKKEVPWSTDNVVNGPTTDGTFTDLRHIIENANPNAVVVLNCNYKFDENVDVADKIHITNKSLIIDGKGHTIDGSNKTAVFWFENQYFVEFKNIIFKNAYNPSNDNSYTGGAISIVGDGRVLNCTFIENTAGRAGAIYWGYSNDCEIKNCTFISNTALAAGGGAIRLRNEMTNVNISNCTFKYNKAPSDGGAIHFSSTQGSHSELIDNCTFIENTAGDNGGALFISAPTCTVSNSKFHNNTAGKSGGAIYCAGTTSIISNSNFTINNATTGGAVYWDGANGIVEYSRFINNNATGDGGALYCHGASSQIYDSYFKDNKASHGGAVRWENTTDGKILKSTFINNFAAVNAGAVSWLNSTRGSINESVFRFNRAATGVGGAIRWSGSNGTIFNATFINNTAYGHGGAISWAEVAANGRILNSRFINNTATNDNGGALYWDHSANGIINGTEFVSNSAVDGGAIYVSGTFCIITQSNFTRDRAQNGAGIFLDVGAYIKNCIFRFENATNDGGAIYLYADNTAIAPELLKDLDIGVVDSKIISCSAGHDGGAGYVYGNYGYVRNLTMIDCFAANNGGAGYISGDSGRLINSTFINNRALRSGGGIYWVGKKGTVTGSNFTSNHALGVKLNLPGYSTPGGNGGSVVWVGQSGEIIDCSFDVSTARNYGGVIYISGNNTFITNSNFTHYNATGNAAQGGAVYVDGFKINITDSRFEFGEASYGGAIYINGGETYIKDSALTHNHARADGGIIYVNGDNTDIISSNLTYSYTQNAGGAIYISGANTTVFDTRLLYNNASDGEGGSIYIKGNHTNITEAYFEFCLSIEGGAIYVLGFNNTVTDSDFRHNNVTSRNGNGGSIFIQGDDNVISGDDFRFSNAANGGILYINGHNNQVLKSSFDSSLAYQTGGAIYINGSNTNITESIFARHNATAGGAIYLAGDNVNITGSNFSYCFATNGIPGTNNGGAIYVAGDYTDISSSNFTITMAIGGNGGVIYISGKNSTVDNCHTNISRAIGIAMGPNGIAGGNGGALYVSGANAVIKNSEFKRYNATLNGGAIYIEGDNAGIMSTDFDMGHARYGGALYISGHSTLVEKSRFIHNNAESDGGVMYVNGDKTRIVASSLSFSYANQSGGAIYIRGLNTTISSSNFTFNNASDVHGGSIYIGGNDSNITDSIFKNAVSAEGGAIYIEGVRTLISNSTFAMNTVSSPAGRGGTIFIRGDKTKIILSDFSQSNAYRGGIIYIEGDDTAVDSSNFTKSNALDGAIMYVDGSNTNITRSRFDSSIAREYGGAIYIDGLNTLISDSSFQRHNATSGGAIYVAGDLTTIDKSNFTLNFATAEIPNPSSGNHNGGSIYVGGDNVTVSNSRFNLTHSIFGDGGAIYATGDNANITGDSFTLTFARNGNGGAIYMGGVNATISGCHANITQAIGMTMGSPQGPVRIGGYGGLAYILGDNATVENSVFERYNSTFDGGALYIVGNLTNVSATRFQYGHAVYGGAIYIEGEKTNLENSNFSYNNADADGGVIYVNGNYTVIAASRFSYSYADNSGGAIYINGINTTICSSNFTYGNATNGFAGSIYVEGDYANITGDSFRFSTAINGGAIYVAGFRATISDSYFQQNNVTSRAGEGGTIFIEGDETRICSSNFTMSTADKGGFIYIDGDRTNITCSSFNRSRAFTWGGAIYVGGENTTISSSAFRQHDAKLGGALYLAGNNTRVLGSNFTMCDALNGGVIFVMGHNALISNSNFTQYNATLDGGALYVEGDDVNVTHSHFEFGEARNGGSIYIDGESTYVSDTTFAHNHAKNDGGVIYISGNNSDINSSEFKFTYSNHSGGAIYIKGVNTTISTSIFLYTNATMLSSSRGGAIYVEGNDTHITGSKFNRGSSHYGGAIYVDGERAIVEKSSFREFTVTNDGGTIYISGDDALVCDSNFTQANANRGGMIYIVGDDANITSSAFDRSHTSHEGGALYIAGVNAYVASSRFSRHNATLGGAVYISGENTRITDSDFNMSHASGVAGGVYLGGTNTTIYNSAFNLNNAYRGGAIYNSGGTAIVMYSNFTNNQARGDSAVQGGAIFWIGGAANDAVIGSYFENNTALTNNLTQTDSYGGAIYWANGEHVTFGASVLNSTFVNNTAGRHGGAVSWYRADDSVIDGCSFISNYAFYDGGGLYVGHDTSDGKNLTVSNCNFTGNYAGGRGGAVSHQFHNSHYINVNFINNSAMEGGSVYSRNGKANCTEFIGCKFINSFTRIVHPKGVGSLDGGAVYLEVPYISFISCEFINCSVSKGHEGAAIFLKSGATHALIDDCTFHNNTNASRGGAVITRASDLVINNSRFSLHSVSNRGGAIWIGGYNTTINNSNFTNSSAEDIGGTVFIGASACLVNNSRIEHSHGKIGGGIYIESEHNTIENTIFNRNNALYEGGSILVHKNHQKLNNLTLANSTSDCKNNFGGGAIAFYQVTDDVVLNNSRVYGNLANWGAGIQILNSQNVLVENTNITNNNATRGSGIHVQVSSYSLVNVILLDNQAHADRFINKAIRMDSDGNYYVTAVFLGQDNLLNGIWHDNNAHAISFTNVTYWDAGGVNTTSVIPDTTQAEEGQNITVTRIYTRSSGLAVTGDDGAFRYYFADDGAKEFKFKFEHLEDTYYTGLSDETSIPATYVTIAVADIDFGENATVSVTLTDRDGNKLTATVNITIDGVYRFTINVVNGVGSKANVAGLSGGVHNATVIFEGNNQYLGSKNSTLFNVHPDVHINITKTTNITGNASVGDLVNYTITVTSLGPSNATNVNVTDTLNPALKYVSSGSNSTYVGVKSTVNGMEVVTWSIGNMTAGTSIRFWIVVRAMTNGTFGNVAAVSSTEGGTNRSNVTNVTVSPVVKLNITKTVNVTNVTVGDLVKFVINVTNCGPSNATNVVVRDALNSAFKFNSTNRGEYLSRDGQKLTWTIPKIENGTSYLIELVVRVISNGTFSNVACVNSTENKTDVPSNTTNVTAKPMVVLNITKSVNVTNVTVGDLVKFIINVTNNGLSNATNVVVTDILNPAFKFNSTNVARDYYSVDGQKVVWTISKIENGTSYLIELVVRVISNGTFSNVAVVNSTENKTNVPSNTTNVTVNPKVILNITKSVNATNVTVGDLVKFTINVTNHGPSNATNVVVVDTLNPAFYFNSTNVSREHYTIDGQKVTFTIPKMVNGTSYIIELVVRVVSNGTFSNVAVVNSTENNTNVSSNATNVTAKPNVVLNITKSVNVTNVTVGDLVRFTINITNNGLSNATNVAVSDALNPAFCFNSTNRAEYLSRDGQKLTWTIPKIENGTSYVIELVVRVVSNGTFSNVAVVNSTENKTNVPSNTTNVTVNPKVVLNITKSVNVTDVSVGDLVKFVINVTNNGLSNATNVVVTDILNSAFKFNSTNVARQHYSVDGQKVIFNIPKLANGTFYIIELVVRVISNGTFSNVAIVNSTENKTNVPSNTSNVTVKPVVNLTVVKTANVTQNLYVGDLVNFTITVTNHGPSNATNVEIVDELSKTFGLVSAPGNTTVVNNRITWIVPKIVSGSNVSVWVVVKLLTNGTFDNAAVVNSTENATTSTNKTNVTVAPKVSLNITKEVNITKVHVGDLVKFTITVNNTGLSNATNVIVTDTLDLAFRFNSTNRAEFCTRDGQKITWTIPKLENGTYYVIELVVKVINNGTFSNVACVNSTENKTNVPSNTTNVTVDPKVVLNITKSVNVTDVSVGDLVKFIINVTNRGLSNATNVVVTDILNPAFKFNSTNVARQHYSVDGQKIIFNIPKLANGTSYIIELVVRVISNGTFSNIAVVNSTENNTNVPSNTSNVTVKPVVNLTVVKTANVTQNLYVGDLVNFTITVTNHGPSNATNVEIVDELDAAFGLVKAYGDKQLVGGKITWIVPKIVNGSNVSVWVVVKLLTNGTFTNAAVADSTENATTSTNKTNVTVAPKVSLNITKEVNITKVHVGDLVKFTITVNNTGLSNATNVIVTDTLDSAFRFNSTNRAELCTRDGQKITWTIPKIENGTAYIIELVVKVINNGTFSNVAVVNSTENKTTVPSNTTNVTVDPKVVLNITKSVNVTDVSVGDLVKFIINVTNRGLSNATNVVVTDILNSAFKFNSTNVARDYYSVDGQKVIFNIPKLANGTSYIIELVVRVISNGTFSNVAIVNSTENKTNVPSNASNVTVKPVVNLTVVKTANVTQNLYVGDLVNFTITVTNHGPSNATNVEIVDELNGAFGLVSAPGNNTITNNKITWIVPKIVNGSSVSVWVVVKLLTNGTFTNAAVANSTENTTASTNKTNVTVAPKVSLNITKEVNITKVHVGDLVKFTITVKNTGLSNATNVIVTDTLDSAFCFNSTDCAELCTRDGQKIIWTISKLENGTSKVIELVVRVISNGTFSNVASVNSTENTTDVPSNSTNVTVSPKVNLTVVKTANVTQNLHVGDMVNFTITVTNHGPSNATNVEIVDELNNAFGFITAYGNKQPANGKITWTIPKIANGTSASVWVVVKILTNGTLTNAAAVNSTENVSAKNSTNITVKPQVSLNITKTANATKISVGDLVKFIITVKNTGFSNATNVVVTDTLDSAFGFNSTNYSQYCTVDGQKITWTVPKIENATSYVIELVVKALTNGTFSNVAVVNSTENTTDVPSNPSDVTVEPKVNLTIIKRLDLNGNDEINVGESIRFIITVKNNGPSNATGVTVTDILSNAFEFVSSNHTTQRNGQRVMWSLGNIDAGETVAVELMVKTVLSGFYSNVAVVNSTESENKTSNRTDVVVLPAVNITVVKKSNLTGNASINDLVNFTITVTNHGPSGATGVNVTDILSDGMEYVASNGRNLSSNRVVWNIAGINRNENISIWVVVRVLSSGTLINTAHVNSTENVTGTSARCDVNVTPAVDLSIFKTVSRTNATVGDMISYTITVKNSGNGTATGVVVSEIMKGKFTVMNITPGKGYYDRENDKWHVGNLSRDEHRTLIITIWLTAEGTVENSVTVTSNEKDINQTNNNCTADNVTVNRKNTPIGLETENITYDDDETIVITLPRDATGTVNVTVGNITYPDQPISGGKVELVVENPAGGLYNVTVQYGGDSKYLPNSTKGAFKVSPKTPHIRIEVVDIYWGEIEILNVTVDAPGFVNITVDGVGMITAALNHSIQTKDVLMATKFTPYGGRATWNLIHLAVGDYPALAVYLGNENYTSVSTSDIFTVMPLKSQVNITSRDIYVGEDAVIDVSLNPKITGNVTVEIDGVKYPLNITGGRGQLIVSGLKAGLKHASVRYDGNETYAPSDNTTAFTVKKIKPPIDVDSYEIYVGDDETITVRLPGDATGTVTITVAGRKYTSQVVNGVATFNVEGLKAGRYAVTASYSGDDKYLSAGAGDSFRVLKIRPEIDVVSPDIDVGDDGVITVRLPVDATGRVTIEIDGRKYTADVKNGKAVFTIPGLDAGLYPIKVWYSGDEKYLPAETAGSMEVRGHEKSYPHHESDLESHRTANPITALLAVLISAGVCQLRRLKK